MGKTPITTIDSPGFVVNRILFPMINEAAHAFEEGVASAEDIDTGMKLGRQLADGAAGSGRPRRLDTTSAILETLERELGDPKYHPATVMDDLMAQGKMGRKSGAGFYDYGK